jgi:Arc-like DNA binding domain
MPENDQLPSTRRPFFFRFPDDLRERLAVEAEAAERTLTAEIVYRLRKSLRPSTRPPRDPPRSPSIPGGRQRKAGGAFARPRRQKGLARCPHIRCGRSAARALQT